MKSTERPLGPVPYLLVDDREENLLVLEALLKADDVQILTARSGREALEILLDREIALALVDVQMPEMDGFELAELMRGSERTRNVPIIFVTAGPRDAGRMFVGYDAGAVDFLFKPIDPHILKNKTATFFALHRQKQLLDAQLADLRQVEEERTRMIEASPDCIGLVDLDGKILSLSKKGHPRLVLVEPSELVDTAWLSLWRPEDRFAATDAMAEARLGTPRRFVAQAATPVPPAWWSVAITPLCDPLGAVDKLLVVARDVTLDRIAQEERDRLTQELAETLRFNEMFVAAISHDLRNPLNAIVMGSELVVGHISSERERKVAEKIRTSARRMTRMLEDLFDLARGRLGSGVQVQLADADLGAVATAVVDEHRVAAADRSLELTVKGDLAGRWDAARLERVLSNLVGNALRHGRSGSRVTVTCDGTHADDVVLAVHNDGAIDPKVANHLFEPFRHMEGTSQGLGLGLYIVKQVVDAHHGRVSVDSSEETGTTFTVALPRKARAGAAAV